jgi:hypothetical protein
MEILKQRVAGGNDEGFEKKIVERRGGRLEGGGRGERGKREGEREALGV